MKISVKNSQTLAGAAVLLLMFSLGLCLALFFKQRPQPQTTAAARPPAPESPSDVVTTFWGLAAEGDIDGANKYWSIGVGRGGLIKVETVRTDWAVLIHGKGMNLAGIEREFTDEEGNVNIVTKVTSRRDPLTLYMRNKLTNVKGQWKVVAISPEDPTSVRYMYGQ